MVKPIRECFMIDADEKRDLNGIISEIGDNHNLLGV
jgi:hypothetical protein